LKQKALAIAKYAKLAAILQMRTGRPILMTPEQIQWAKKLQSQGVGLRRIAEELGVSHKTVRQYLKTYGDALKPMSQEKRLTISVNNFLNLETS